MDTPTHTIDRIVTNALQVVDLVAELEEDWQYLSEEHDRWGTSFVYQQTLPDAANDESVTGLIIRHIQEFERLYRQSEQSDLVKIPVIRNVLEKGRLLVLRIKNGEFLSYFAEEAYLRSTTREFKKP